MFDAFKIGTSGSRSERIELIEYELIEPAVRPVDETLRGQHSPLFRERRLVARSRRHCQDRAMLIPEEEALAQG